MAAVSLTQLHHNVLTVRPHQGDARWWAVCSHCGHVDETSEAGAKMFSGTCLACEDDELAQPFDPMRLYGVPRFTDGA